MATRIAIKDIVKTFKTPAERGKAGGTTRALDQVSVDIQPGELFFLLGPSGCGKTTLLRAIAGFVDPNAGTITFERDGESRDITHLPANRRRTAMVFQSYALWPHMTVADNVAFGLKVRKIPDADRKARVAEALEAVEMQDYAARKPTQLSGGQQQRVALARALVVRPDVLLLDEPLSNLDAKLRTDLRARIRQIVKNAGLTAVYVTHDQKEALSMADRIAVMRNGRVEQVGPPAELYHRPTTPFVGHFLGETNDLPVTASTADDGSYCVRIFNTLELKPAHAPSPQPGDKRALIRPEAVRFTPPTDQGLRAEIAEVTFLGEHVQYSATTADGTPVRSTSSDTTTMWNVGDTVGIDLDPRRLVVLNA